MEKTYDATSFFMITTDELTGHIHVEFSPKFAELHPVTLVNNIKQHIKQEQEKKMRAVADGIKTLMTLHADDIPTILAVAPDARTLADAIEEWRADLGPAIDQYFGKIAA